MVRTAAGVLGLVLVAALLLAACGASVRPPPAPEAPRAVYLLDHGRHSSLVLTGADARPVRYAYAERRWYVHDETGPLRALAALFWRTDAVLGRRQLSAAAPAQGFDAEVASVIEAVHSFPAEAAAVDALLASLDALFDARAATLHRSEAMQLDFVAHPEPYTLGNNSNHKVAEWLEALGCEVRGNPVAGRWRFEPR